MAPKKHDVDYELIEAATDVAKTFCHGKNHTVASAARSKDGHIVTAVNAYHFTGGPCAELVVIGAAASQGYYDLERIVSVGDGDWRILPPCGRCRQALFDYFPTIEVIVGAGDRALTYSIGELLPETFDWAGQKRPSESD
jgi:cytidine deaminase